MSNYLLHIDHIGNTCPQREGEPQQGTLDGAFDALRRWELDDRFDLSNDPGLEPHPEQKPFRGPALAAAGCTFKDGHKVWLHGAPIYPEHPHAVTYTMNFLNVTFGIRFTTDDPELIAKTDAAIAHNRARPSMTVPLDVIGQAGHVVARGKSSSAHPNTLKSGEWYSVQRPRSAGAVPDNTPVIQEVRALALWDGDSVFPALQAWSEDGPVPMAVARVNFAGVLGSSESLALRRAQHAAYLVRNGVVANLGDALHQAGLKNVLGATPIGNFYIWANEDCSNVTSDWAQAKSIWKQLRTDGAELVHIVDADGVEVVDDEMEAEEARAAHHAQEAQAGMASQERPSRG